MTSFESASDRRDAEERRRSRRAEARRRVESGEASPPPAPAPTPAPSTRSPRRTPPRKAPATVDPTTSGRSARFGVWRSAQHFCVTDSLPDAEGGDLGALVDFAAGLDAFRLRPRLIARLDDDVWNPVAYAKDGQRQPIAQAQADRYRDRRRGLDGSAEAGSRPLGEGDHPAETVHL